MEIERNGAPRDTAAAGSTSWEDFAVAFGNSYAYRLRHVTATVEGQWSAPWTQPVVADAPQTMVCASSQGQVSCGWSLGEANDTTEVWRRPQGGSWSVLVKVRPGFTQTFDLNVVVGQTYCYKARHRRGAVVTGFSNTSCTTVTGGDPGPLPGRPEPPPQ